MNKPILLVLILASALTVGLYSLPRWVVQTKNQQLGGRASDSPVKDSLGAVANSGAKDKSTVEHNAPLQPEQARNLETLHQQFVTATPTGKLQVANQLISFFRSIQKYDSAAHYTEVIATLEPTEVNFLKAGDQYYEAYGFAVDEAKAARLGEKTREIYKKALDQNPNLLSAKANMAMTYVSTQTPMAGITMLREVLQEEPTNELALFNLGLLSMRSGQYQRAIERFRQILVNSPDNRKALFYLGVSLAEANQKPEALKILARVKSQEKDPQILAAVREYEQQLKP
ncbi:MAG: tetratricopeptide repeat protein [Bacteroidetes bacterium]|nr:tetratricopeptide repeat protein [Fibrella sp.]